MKHTHKNVGIPTKAYEKMMALRDKIHREKGYCAPTAGALVAKIIYEHIEQNNIDLEEIMEDHEKFNPCFDDLRYLCEMLLESSINPTDEELGAYTREFFISMMSGVHMNDAFFEYTLKTTLLIKQEKRKKKGSAGAL